MEALSENRNILIGGISRGLRRRKICGHWRTSEYIQLFSYANPLNNLYHTPFPPEEYR